MYNSIVSDKKIRLARRRWLADPGDLSLQAEYFSQLLHAGYDCLSPEMQELLLPVAQQVLSTLETSFQVESRPHSNLTNIIGHLSGPRGPHSTLSMSTTGDTRPGSILASQYLSAYQTQNSWQLVSGFNHVDTFMAGHIGHGAITSVSVYLAPQGIGIRKFGWLALAPGWLPAECPLDSLGKMMRLQTLGPSAWPVHTVTSQQHPALDAVAPIQLVAVDDDFRINNFGKLDYSEIPLHDAQDFWDLLQKLTTEFWQQMF